MSAQRSAATALETVATGVWVGACAGFAFVCAPIAFHLVQDRDVFAKFTEQSLARLATLTYGAGGLAGALALGSAGFERADRTSDIVRGLTAIGALVCIGYHERAIVPAMTRAQAAMGSFANVADDDAQRVAYRILHKQSTRVFGAAMAFGIAQLFLAASRTGGTETSS